MPPVVCLISDFGTMDAYAGIMKGVLLRICPDAKIVDLTHEIEPQDILAASYALYSAWDYFPKKTVFVCVVDPGVGSARKELIAWGRGKFLVCPDNGIPSLLVRMKKEIKCRELRRTPIERRLKKPAGNTFQGRDIFAPAAALICKQKHKSLLGPAITPQIIPEVYPEIRRENGTVKGKILHIDRFGNCISSIHLSDTSGQAYKGQASMEAAGLEIPTLSRTFSDAAQGQALAYWGSAGFLEIAVRNGHAANSLKLSILDEIILR